LKRKPRPRRKTGPQTHETPGLAARRFAADAIFALIARRRSIEDVLEGGEKGLAFLALDERDRALARMIVMQSLRRLGSLRLTIERFLQGGWPEDTRVHAILIVGAAQILLLEVPDRAAVDLSVRLASLVKNARYSGLVNAVLRRVAVEGRAVFAALDAAADTPDWLAQRWQAVYGRDTFAQIAAAHRLEPALDLSTGNDPAALAEALGGIVLPQGTVRLLAKGPVPQMPGYHEGRWWVQDAAAALPARLLGDVRGKRIADLCAAPGGKTMQLAAGGANVVAVDRSAPRLKRLQENLARLSLQAEIVCADATAWDSGPLDGILLDAPCSATGTIRRHPDILWQKEPADLAQLTRLQERLLDRAAALLAPGAMLVYSTCSLEPEEGEHQILRLLERHSELERVPVRAEETGEPGAITVHGDLRTLPFHFSHADSRLSGCDGFFASRLRRRA
jgi:16S rRNA (cytosine967-C5)-methyltransferase